MDMEEDGSVWFPHCAPPNPCKLKLGPCKYQGQIRPEPGILGPELPGIGHAFFPLPTQRGRGRADKISFSASKGPTSPGGDTEPSEAGRPRTAAWLGIGALLGHPLLHWWIRPAATPVSQPAAWTWPPICSSKAGWWIHIRQPSAKLI